LIVRTTLWVLRICVLLALILGIVLWTGHGDSLVLVHMGLGILVVLSLWVLAAITATARGGNWGLAGGAFVLGLLIVALGLRQQSLLVGPAHWIIQVVHLLLGLSAAGMGEAIAGRYKRFNAVKTVAA
jgi:hypothetical protein